MGLLSPSVKREKSAKGLLSEIMANKAQSRYTPDETVSQIIRLWCEGVSSVKIAKRLGVSRTTVCKYINRLKKQLSSLMFENP